MTISTTPDVAAPAPPPVDRQASRPPSLLAEHLPRYLAADPFLVNLLYGFEKVALELYDLPARFPTQLDPRIGERSVSDWMAEWLGLRVDGALDETRARALISTTMERFGTRGTKAELIASLEAATGGRCEVDDPGGVRFGSRLLSDGRYSTPATLSEYHDMVTVRLEKSGGLSQQALARIVEDNLPVGLAYRIDVGYRFDRNEDGNE